MEHRKNIYQRQARQGENLIREASPIKKRVLLTYRTNEFYPTDYIARVTEAGLDPVLHCFHESPPKPKADEFFGLLLCGGIDIDPKYFGQELHEKSEIEPGFDAFEFEVLKDFMDQKKPILGICRGAQVICVALSGTLHQHLPDIVNHNHSGDSHSVTITPGSRLSRLFPGETLAVNSRHHQAAATLPKTVLVSAVSPEGVIECFEQGNIFAIQWHPENLGEPMMPIFHDFAAGFP